MKMIDFTNILDELIKESKMSNETNIYDSINYDNEKMYIKKIVEYENLERGLVREESDFFEIKIDFIDDSMSIINKKEFLSNIADVYGIHEIACGYYPHINNFIGKIINNIEDHEILYYIKEIPSLKVEGGTRMYIQNNIIDILCRSDKYYIEQNIKWIYETLVSKEPIEYLRANVDNPYHDFYRSHDSIIPAPIIDEDYEDILDYLDPREFINKDIIFRNVYYVSNDIIPLIKKEDILNITPFIKENSDICFYETNGNILSLFEIDYYEVNNDQYINCKYKKIIEINIDLPNNAYSIEILNQANSSMIRVNEHLCVYLNEILDPEVDEEFTMEKLIIENANKNI